MIHVSLIASIYQIYDPYVCNSINMSKIPPSFQLYFGNILYWPQIYENGHTFMISFSRESFHCFRYEFLTLVSLIPSESCLYKFTRTKKSKQEGPMLTTHELHSVGR